MDNARVKMDDKTELKRAVPETFPDLNLMDVIPREWIEPYLAGASSMKTYLVEKSAIIGRSAREKLDSFSNFEFEDWWTLEGIIYLTLFTAIFMSILVISKNVYRKIRYAIPATVNCWFCNTNTKVLYSLRDTWTCPNCHQYNGFNSDGSYNKRIPAQFIEALNRPIRGRPADGYEVKNGQGLCSQCNLNQVLKVFQLSSFVPVNERNYDAEIEAEQKRLEQLYDICQQCKSVVEETLKRTPDKKSNLHGGRKVNKVTPNLPMPIRVTEPLTLNLHGSGTFSNSKDVSSGSENDSSDSFLSLDNLKIGSKRKSPNQSFNEFHTPVCSSPSITPPQRLSPGCSVAALNNRSTTVSPSSIQQQPLWKDYPMVQAGLSRSYSVFDTMSCPVGRPAYVSYGSPVSSAGGPGIQFSYQSSNMGSVFGGQRPVISPQKFCNSNTHTFAPHIRFGAYYDITSSPNIFLNNSPPVMFSPNYFPNPISRSSSQSSGFVSQQGGVVTSQPQSPTANTPGFYVPS